MIGLLLAIAADRLFVAPRPTPKLSQSAAASVAEQTPFARDHTNVFVEVDDWAFERREIGISYQGGQRSCHGKRIAARQPGGRQGAGCG
jgi:hypothetical protein